MTSHTSTELQKQRNNIACKKYRQKHKTERKAYNKQYQQNHKDLVNHLNKCWRIKNKEYVKQLKKASYFRNKKIVIKSRVAKSNIPYRRLCAGCGQVQYYKKLASWLNADNKNSICIKCSNKHNIGKKLTEEHKKNISLSQIGKFVGDKGPGWKGGVTPRNRIIRQMLEYKSWRFDVFSRDNFSCVKCGTKSPLQADHIYPFYKILEEKNIWTVDEARHCKELWNIDNGRTLCVRCHKETNTYGRKGGQ